MGIKVTIIDDSDKVGIAAAVTRTGELYMTGVGDMVVKILAHVLKTRETLGYVIGKSLHEATKGRTPPPILGPGLKMSRLNVLDHGNATGLQIGSDWVTTATFDTYRPLLALLAPHFESDGFVHLQHCNVGQNLHLLEMFADTFGVAVVAGKGKTNPVYRFNTGNFLRVHPAKSGSRPTADTFFWGPSDQ